MRILLTLPVAAALAGRLASQTLVVDRGLSSGGGAPKGRPERVERAGNQGFLGDSFKVGASGETWVLDTIRVWASPGEAPSCPKLPGDRLEKITLLGALDNPPVPGQPACACHALVTIASAALEPGAAGPANSSVKLAPLGALWRLDFENLRWSVPGGLDVLYAVRATARSNPACNAGKNWALSASPAAAGWRLFTFDKDALEDGFSAKDQPRWFNLQVWAHRSQ